MWWLEITKGYSYQTVTVSTFLNLTTYDTVLISLDVSTINYVAQMLLFIAYVYYTYQLSKDVSNPAIMNGQQALFRKIGFVMGAIVYIDQ